MQLAGKSEKTYQIGIPIHWGYRGIDDGRPENERTLANQLVTHGDRSQRLHTRV